ncbi:hypothetical protein Trydic_g2771 [Trypoxylus dichotomus]
MIGNKLYPPHPEKQTPLLHRCTGYNRVTTLPCVERGPFASTVNSNGNKTSPISGEHGGGGSLLAQMNMAGYLKTPTGPHGHYPPHPGLSAGISSGLAGMPMPALGHFAIGHSLESVPFPQGKSHARRRIA